MLLNVILNKTGKRTAYYGGVNPVYQGTKVKDRELNRILYRVSKWREGTALKQYRPNIGVIANKLLGEADQLLLNLVPIKMAGALYDIFEFGQVLRTYNYDISQITEPALAEKARR